MKPKYQGRNIRSACSTTKPLRYPKSSDLKEIAILAFSDNAMNLFRLPSTTSVNLADLASRSLHKRRENA
jgi:hypothetical protein